VENTTSFSNNISPAQIRQRLFDTVIADLLGPAGGPEELLDEPYVRDRYLVGRLAPRRQRNRGKPTSEEEIDDFLENEFEGSLATAGVDDEDGATDQEIAYATSLQPNAIGLSFVCTAGSTALQITVRWGQYVREAGPGEAYQTPQGRQRRIWRRIPAEFTLPPVPLEAGRFTLKPDPNLPEIKVDGLIRARGDEWHVTIFLVNGQEEPKQNQDAAWLFQPEISVATPDGSPIFTRRPHLPIADDAEMQAMTMRYRRTVEFAVGHGVAVHAEVDPQNPFCAVRLTTRVVPFFDVAQTIPFVPPGLVTDMRALATLPDGQFQPALLPLVEAYDAWIDRLAQRLVEPPEDLIPFREQAERVVQQCRETSVRIRAGIQLLDTNPLAAQAFRFANRAMADQRVHSIHAANVRQEKPSALEQIEAEINNHT
jgi:hypothetical protein